MGRKREDNSLKIYTLFQLFREYFFIHLMDGEFFKLMSKEEYWFTWNACVHVLRIFSIINTKKYDNMH